ncbi:CPXCG motif-containing cysteine-rich protein [Verrucomicrobiales bacterium]|nr:CPXCG motif-containing cysteine-rich protein [Verrucomicrobiales bacterium]
MDTCPVTCPTCFEEFLVALPPLEETPCDIDYDCEVCCRPMFISFSDDGDGEVGGFARGIHD